MTNPRFVGLDIHKRHVMVAAVNQQQERVISPQKISIQGFTNWAHENLVDTDRIALEATSNAWAIL